jgi:hypothetical protein
LLPVFPQPYLQEQRLLAAAGSFPEQPPGRDRQPNMQDFDFVL